MGLCKPQLPYLKKKIHNLTSQSYWEDLNKIIYAELQNKRPEPQKGLRKG